MAVGFGGFLLWAAFAPLDEGVPTSGQVSIETKRKAVQHLQGGIVREVLVKEGQHVEAGQTLLRLNSSVSQAGYESARQQYFAVRAMESRLLAEQLGKDRISFHADLLEAGNQPLIQQHVSNQQQLFQSRRQGLRAELQATQEAIEGQEGVLQGYKETLATRKEQRALLERQLVGIRELVQEGYAPRNRQIDLERTASEITGAAADVQGNIVRTRQAIAELKLRQVQRQQEFRKEVDTQLAEVRREVEADERKFKAAGEELDRIEIRSPASGQVVGLEVQAVGATVQPYQKLMDIVPANELLLLETQIAPQLIDRVKEGLKVDVRFSAFANSPQLVVDGRIESVSGDVMTNSAEKSPYYQARVSITPEGMKQLGKRELRPGMPVEVVIKTGERSLLIYLLHPLLKRLAASLKEE
jgi:protease secretion system membrane fusion protein